MHRRDKYRLVQGRQQQPHHRRIDPRYRTCQSGSGREPLPALHEPQHQQETGQKNGQGGDQGTPPWAGRQQHRPQVRRQREHGPGHCLGSGIASEKLIRGHLWPNQFLQQGQHHMATTEHQRAGGKEIIPQAQPPRRGKKGNEREQHKRHQRPATPNRLAIGWHPLFRA